MSTAKTTLIGQYNYLDRLKEDLFINLSVPEEINRTALINKILLEGGEFETLYADPYFLQKAIGIWSIANTRTFLKWQHALNIQYDPLYNYDRKEEWTDTHTGTDSYKSDMVNKTNGTDGGSDTTVSDSTDKISAFDNDTFVNNTQNESNGTNTHSATYSNTVTNDANNINTKNLTDKHTARMYGNIGVTTSQQMLESELDIAEWSIYQHITDMFIQEFCILVYE